MDAGEAVHQLGHLAFHRVGSEGFLEVQRPRVERRQLGQSWLGIVLARVEFSNAVVIRVDDCGVERPLLALEAAVGFAERVVEVVFVLG